MPLVSDLCYVSTALNDFGFVILDLVQKINRYTSNGAFTPHGTETGKNGFLYIMQNCSHCMEEGQGPGMGAGSESLAMGSKPIFLVPLLVTVPPFRSRFRAVWTTHKVNVMHLEKPYKPGEEQRNGKLSEQDLSSHLPSLTTTQFLPVLTVGLPDLHFS